MNTSNHEGSNVHIKCIKGLSFEGLIIPKGSILKHTGWEEGDKIFTILNGFCEGMELSLLDSEIVKYFKLVA